MNMLSTAAPWDLVAEGYSEITMGFFQGYCDAALALVDPRPDDVVVDVACGPGTLALAAANRVASVAAVDFSESMIAMLRNAMSQRGVANINPHHGDGQDLPYPDGAFDAGFSMFGLMFFPDRTKGYAELFRTLKPGGRVCVSSWAPVERSPMMQVMFGAMMAVNPDIPPPKTDPDSLENPELLRSELMAAGFTNVAVTGVTERIHAESAAAFWEAMVKGSAPIAMMKSRMPEDMWYERSRIAVESIREAVDTFPASLSADAWLGVGTR